MLDLMCGEKQRNCQNRNLSPLRLPFWRISLPGTNLWVIQSHFARIRPLACAFRSPLRDDFAD
ncbi:MAG: hypothetical protein DME99_11580 [Verrucomicrobia bacterium]|nr:MAG: hypothetical protein DME99_11580 [Verrucomicrobiota bacterium]